MADSIIELRQYNKSDVNHIRESVTVVVGDTEALLHSHLRRVMGSNAVKHACLKRTFKAQKALPRHVC